MSTFLKSIKAIYKASDPRRQRTCNHCGISYTDVSRRLTRKSCSDECGYAYGVTKRKANGTYERTEEMNEVTRQSLQKFHAESEGWSDERRDQASQKMKQTWANGRIDTSKHWSKTDEGREYLRFINTGKKRSLEAIAKSSRSQSLRVRTKRESLYTSANGGTRADLNMYFRSNWEANFARIMNFLGHDWQYESETFQLTDALSYTPDFLVNGEFYELKGRMTEKCSLQIRLFREQNSALVLHVIEAAQYDDYRRQYKQQIPLWEGK